MLMAEASPPLAENSNLQVCVLCASDLKDKSPKLLSCLHTLCENCLNSLFQVQIQQKRPNEENGDIASEEKGENLVSENCSILCPACNATVEKSLVLDNLFVQSTPIVIEDEEEKEEESHVCTGCDENQDATSFCAECKEWLCDQCVIAHKRVRITKDHTIQSKEEAKKIEDDANSTPQKIMFCTVHKNEQLKLFCETCDRLTCRDCQLEEHKDHKYQFLSEAIKHQRENLQNAVVKLKQKLGNYHQADKILTSKNTELKSKLNDVCQNMRDVADSITKEITKHTDNLIQYLEKYVSSKTSVISDKQRLVKEALDKMKHTIEFVENALTVGDDTSILYAKGVMMKTLRALANNGIPFHPSILNYSISYEHEKDFILRNVHKAGTLVIDNQKFPPVPGQRPAPSSQQVHTAASQANVYPHSVMPNRTTNASGYYTSRNSIPPRIQQTFSHLSTDEQRNLTQKIYNMWTQQQGPEPSSGAANYQHQVPSSHVTPVDQSVRNLTNLVNGVPSQRPMQPTSNIRFRHTAAILQSKVNTPKPPGPERVGMQLPTNSLHSTMQPRQASPMGGMARPHASAGDPVRSSISPSSAADRIIAGRTFQGHPSGKSWNFVDMGSRFHQPAFLSHIDQGSPGPQAASHQNKTPSPAGAGFDESSTGQVRLDARSPSATGNHVKAENKQLSSCQFSSATSDTSPLQERHMTTPPPRASPLPPPPLIHTSNLQSNNTPSPSQGKQMPESKEDDPNEDYCAVCQNGGDLLCCDKCPKVYHLKCHIPELKEFPSDEWQCTLCTKADDMVLTEIEKKDFTMGPGKRKAPSGLTEKELRACERILLELYTNKDSAVFHEPVSKLVPNYYKIITRPIDFSKIRSKLQRQNFNHYNTVEEFLSDCKLVFKNCVTYNSVGTPIYDQGKMLDEEFERLVQKFLPCYFDILDDLDTRTDTPVSDASDGGPGEKKKKKRYEDDPDASPVHIH
ncbi:E3 ubiquitin-protein ligase TRIM33-like isoform X1 [Saccostrea echinata]|uniref:E3 ubiquitin-protein ligase TRIM33-like isoform X1 n=1 Tax=Saccostrea echinata TaxID=191078 RepID=UPI002A8327FD|nr:E3 ubiquitin-protein ligase TRIM33-like isoform X1 [Saccostrea echinata]